MARPLILGGAIKLAVSLHAVHDIRSRRASDLFTRAGMTQYTWDRHGLEVLDAAEAIIEHMRRTK